MFTALGAPTDTKLIWGFPSNLQIIKDSPTQILYLFPTSTDEKIKKLLVCLAEMFKGNAQTAIEFYAEHKSIQDELYYFRWVDDLEVIQMDGKFETSAKLFHQSLTARIYNVMLLFLGLHAKAIHPLLQPGITPEAFDRFLNIIRDTHQCIASEKVPYKAVFYVLKPFATKLYDDKPYFDKLNHKNEIAKIRKQPLVRQKESGSIAILQYYSEDQQNVFYKIISTRSLEPGSPGLELENLYSLDQIEKLISECKSLLQSPVWSKESNAKALELFGMDYSDYIGMKSVITKSGEPLIFPFAFGGYPFSLDKAEMQFDRYEWRKGQGLTVKVIAKSESGKGEFQSSKMIIVSPTLFRMATLPLPQATSQTELVMQYINQLFWQPQIPHQFTGMVMKYDSTKRQVQKDPSTLQINLQDRMSNTACGYNVLGILSCLADYKLFLSKSERPFPAVAESLLSAVDHNEDRLLQDPTQDKVIFYLMTFSMLPSTGDRVEQHDFHQQFAFIQYKTGGAIRYKRIEAYYNAGATLWSRLLENVSKNGAIDGTLSSEEFDASYKKPLMQLTKACGKGWSRELIDIYHAFLGPFQFNRMGLDFTNVENTFSAEWEHIELHAGDLIRRFEEIQSNGDKLPQLQYHNPSQYRKLAEDPKFPNLGGISIKQKHRLDLKTLPKQ